MESELGLSEWAADAGERRGARLSALVALLAAIVLTPFAAVPLPVSYPLFAMILAASFMSTSVTALLLLFQARALRSVPTLVLAAGFFFASATIVPYALTYPGMIPPLDAWLATGGATNGILWFSWHAGTLVAMLAFSMLRRSRAAPDALRATARRIVGAFAVAYALVTAGAIWLHGLPSTFEHDRWSPFFLGIEVPAIAALATGVVVESLRRRSRATVLDVWIGLLAFAMLIDVYLTTVGATRFTAGWYASRVVMLLATTGVLGTLLRQTAQMYAALVVRAEVLEGEAHTDTLTGLPNRRRFDEEYARAFGSALRRGAELSITIIDIDRFKLYNDAFGHQAGDEALHTIAQTIARSVERSGDVTARYGGEEFVVILEYTTLAGAVAVAERIRGAVFDAGIRMPEGGILTVSAGVANRQPGDGPDDLLGHADAALYRAKNDGRNRVAAWQPATVS